jgi:hypothetical protein
MARIPEILAAHDDKVEEYRGRIAAVASRYEWRFQRFLASNRTAYFLDGIIRVSDSRPLDPGTYKTLGQVKNLLWGPCHRIRSASPAHSIPRVHSEK